MSKTKTAETAIDTKVKVNLPGKTEQKVFIERNLSSKGVADDMTSRITAKLIGFDDIFDPKTQQFLTEKELKAKGAVFITVSLNKVMVFGKDTVKKSRITGEVTPFIRKTSKYQVIANINWESYVNKRGHGSFIPAEKSANGVENYCECKGIGTLESKDGNTYYYVKGVAFRVLEATKYFDSNGVEYADKDGLEAEYLKKASKASKQREADKHGIELKFDPQFRSTRIDNCDMLRCFGFEYKPTDNIQNK